MAYDPPSIAKVRTTTRTWKSVVKAFDAAFADEEEQISDNRKHLVAYEWSNGRKFFNGDGPYV